MPGNKQEAATVQQMAEECKMQDGSAEKREYKGAAVRGMSEMDVKEVALIEDASFTTPWTAQGFVDALQNPNAYCLVAELILRNINLESQDIVWCIMQRTRVRYPRLR